MTYFFALNSLSSTLLASTAGAYQASVTQLIQSHLGPETDVPQSLQQPHAFLAQIAQSNEIPLQAMFRFHEATVVELPWAEIPLSVRQAVIGGFNAASPEQRIQLYFDAVLEAMAEGSAQVISLHEVPTPRLDNATQALCEIVFGELILLGFEAAARDQISHGTAALRDANAMQRLQRDHDKDFATYSSLWMDAAEDFPEYQMAIRQLQQVLRNYRASQNSYPFPAFEMTMQLQFTDIQDLQTRTLVMALLFDRLHVRETMKKYIDDAEAVTQGLLAAIDAYGDSGPSIGLIVRSILSGRLELNRSES